MLEKNKVKCSECSWKGMANEMLIAKNPFDEEDEIVGCPRCKSVDTIMVVCDENGCWEESSCGTPSPEGYRRTCGKHKPTIYKMTAQELN